MTGTCTWAIVNLKDIPLGRLPHAPPGPYPASDVATFDQFYDSGLIGVDSRCLRHGDLGYAIVGKCFPRSFKQDKSNRDTDGKGAEHSLVILVTGTKSNFDRSLPRGVHPPPQISLPGNVTQNALEGQNIAIPVLGELNETTSFTTAPQQDVQSS